MNILAIVFSIFSQIKYWFTSYCFYHLDFVSDINLQFNIKK